MKKYLAILLSALLVLGLAACGGSEKEQEPTAAPTQAPTEAPVTEATPEPAEETTEAPTEAPAEEDDIQETIDLVLSMVGQPIEDLYAAIGEPTNGSDYTPSCLVDGQDGQLFYDGFTVYTCRRLDDGYEYIYMVL